MKWNTNLTIAQLYQKVASIVAKYIKDENINNIVCHYNKTSVTINIKYKLGYSDYNVVISEDDIKQLNEKIKMKLKEL